MPQLHEASFFLQCKDIEKTLRIMVMNECDVLACKAKGIKQEQEGAVASAHTICKSFWSSVVNIFKECSDKWGRILARAVRSGHNLEKIIKGIGGILMHCCQCS